MGGTRATGRQACSLTANRGPRRRRAPGRGRAGLARRGMLLDQPGGAVLRGPIALGRDAAITPSTDRENSSPIPAADVPSAAAGTDRRRGGRRRRPRRGAARGDKGRTGPCSAAAGAGGVKTGRGDRTELRRAGSPTAVSRIGCRPQPPMPPARPLQDHGWRRRAAVGRIGQIGVRRRLRSCGTPGLRSCAERRRTAAPRSHHPLRPDREPRGPITGCLGSLSGAQSPSTIGEISVASQHDDPEQSNTEYRVEHDSIGEVRVPPGPSGGPRPSGQWRTSRSRAPRSSAS